MENASNPVGRPRLISTPEEFDRRVDLYMAMCQDPDNPKPITLTGLVLALGFCSKDTLYEYEKYPEFTDSVKRSRTFIEHEYENRLVAGNNATAPIFALKNFGWKDKQEIDTNLNHSGSLHNQVEWLIIDPTQHTSK